MSEFNTWFMLLVVAVTMIGGIAQSTTGFGAGVIIMMVLPLFSPMHQSSALSCITNLALCITLTYTYRKHIRFKAVWIPLIFYLISSNICIYITTLIDMAAFKVYFGIVLILLGLYFLIFSNRVKVSDGRLTAAVCGFLGGICSGFFGFGGPPAVLYYLAVAKDDKECFLGTSQFFFSLCMICSLTSRMINGVIDLNLWPIFLLGVIGVIAGKLIGTKIVGKINAKQMKFVIYLFLLFCGVLTFVLNAF